MPRYFFDIHDGSTFFRDMEGTECDGGETVRREAMLVRDEHNMTVYMTTLTFAGLWMGDIPIT